MIEVIDPDILSLISASLGILIILYFVWKSKFFEKQFTFAKALPTEISSKAFLVAVFFNSIPVIVDYWKWILKYFLRVGWYLIIFIIISNAVNDFELSIIIVLAIVTAKVTASGSKLKKGADVIILSQAEHERIKKGEAKFSDFEVQK